MSYSLIHKCNGNINHTLIINEAHGFCTLKGRCYLLKNFEVWINFGHFSFFVNCFKFNKNISKHNIVIINMSKYTIVVKKKKKVILVTGCAQNMFLSSKNKRKKMTETGYFYLLKCQFGIYFLCFVRQYHNLFLPIPAIEIYLPLFIAFFSLSLSLTLFFFFFFLHYSKFCICVHNFQ